MWLIWFFSFLAGMFFGYLVAQLRHHERKSVTKPETEQPIDPADFWKPENYKPPWAQEDEEELR